MSNKRDEKPGEKKVVLERPKMVDLTGKEITREELIHEELEGGSGGLNVEQTCNYGGFVHDCNGGGGAFEEA